MTKEREQLELTLRDYFAAKALQGQAGLGGAPHTQAKWAYELADAMLAEREKKYD